MLHGEIVCCICQGASSRDNNEIVLCDKCGAGKTMVLSVLSNSMNFYVYFHLNRLAMARGHFTAIKTEIYVPVIKIQ